MSRLATERQRVLYEAREIYNKDFLAFDTETTGLGPEDQIIQWAICNREGEVIAKGHIKPTVPISEGAFDKHGISEEQLEEAPTFEEVWPFIRLLLCWKTIVIYNADFDISKLFSSAVPYGIEIPYTLIKTICAMKLFARLYGQVHEYWGTYTWQPLNEVVIPYLNITVPGQAHNAGHDAAATAMIIKQLAELANQELPTGWHPPVMVPCAGGCREVVKECAEADEIWYCQQCGLREGIFHHCPGCTRVLETPATGVLYEDMCEYCHKRLHQEMMLLTGAWHWCPNHRYPLTLNIVETPDLTELCKDCQRQLEWKRIMAEDERKRQEKIAQQRKEERREYARAYRQREKDRKKENIQRAAEGLPLLEKPVRPKPPEIFSHHGHKFQRRKDQRGKKEVFCLICEGTWSRPPRGDCNRIKTYWSWAMIPGHLKTRTQLKKLKLKLTEGQNHVAVMETSYDCYNLYDQSQCIPTRGSTTAARKTT